MLLPQCCILIFAGWCDDGADGAQSQRPRRVRQRRAQRHGAQVNITPTPALLTRTSVNNCRMTPGIWQRNVLPNRLWT